VHRFLFALALVLLWPATASAKSVTCRSGHTVLRQGGARIFSTVRKYERGELHQLYLCSTAVRRPREFDDDYDVDARPTPTRSAASASASRTRGPGRTP
jgi:hypothetical protein